MKLFVVANRSKPHVSKALDEWLPWMTQRVEIVGIDEECAMTLDAINADIILALGGDGTLLAAARRLNGKPTPLMGVNFGRLGFLASFSPDRFTEHFELLITDKLPITSRLVLEASVTRGDAQLARATALNDAVITAGPPFHMINLDIRAG